MVPKSGFAAMVVAVLAWCGVAAAAEYRADEYLGLDLSKALLSPRRLGPPAQFAPVPVEAKSDSKADSKPGSKAATVDRARAAPRDASSRIAAEQVRGSEPKGAHARAEGRRGSARAKLAHRHTSPLDAQAMDTRVQVWPCRSGGICNWKR